MTTGELWHRYLSLIESLHLCSSFFSKYLVLISMVRGWRWPGLALTFLFPCFFLYLQYRHMEYIFYDTLFVQKLQPFQ